ncbi:glycosyltransferase family 61 protein [Halomonas sp. M20]|uniref:glycosyltransferase family 61 protein n=1 Tax=Halomonas sp. M20 TaxID=2763264 RepID=UPI001D0B5421|nr:glycosyltransferase family 61 protein [Halomonas sp. M20]
MKKILNTAVRSSMDWLEERFTVAPDHKGMPWQDQSHVPRMGKYPAGKQPVNANEPCWQKVEPVAKPGVCRLHQARVWSLHATSSTIAPDPHRRLAIVFDKHRRRLKTPASPYVWAYYLKHREWRRKNRHTAHLAGRVALLGNFVSDSNNYYHFWADIVSDIWYLRQSLPASEMPERYLMAYTGVSWQRQILELCGIREDQVIPLSDHDWLNVDELVVPIRPKGSEDQPSWQADAIRGMANWAGIDRPATRRLYLSRADAPRRRVANEAQVRERLEPLGFEVLTLDGLSVREQQALFASASTIIAPHGAALTNLVWCKPGTLVVDFLSENHLAPCFRELAAQSEVIYHPIVCRSVDDTISGFDSDIEIDMAQLDTALKVLMFKNASIYALEKARLAPETLHWDNDGLYYQETR